ncbi:MAG: hypothetical protein P9M14_13460 [Candidatus Alcyoniella australis]|nr:hypothetical protein [Candidatus Alcyoniella australis]
MTNYEVRLTPYNPCLWLSQANAMCFNELPQYIGLKALEFLPWLSILAERKALKVVAAILEYITRNKLHWLIPPSLSIVESMSKMDIRIILKEQAAFNPETFGIINSGK